MLGLGMDKKGFKEKCEENMYVFFDFKSIKTLVAF